MTGDFDAKPKTAELARRVVAFVASFGPSRRDAKAQLSFGRKRKFIWLWSYEHTADGTLFVTVCLDCKLEGAQFQYVKQVSPHRWNHHVVKSADQVESAWFADLVQKGYEFSNA